MSKGLIRTWHVPTTTTIIKSTQERKWIIFSKWKVMVTSSGTTATGREEIRPTETWTWKDDKTTRTRTAATWIETTGQTGTIRNQRQHAW